MEPIERITELVTWLTPIGNITSPSTWMDKENTFEYTMKPAIKWLNDNGHPHMTILITPTSAELVEGVQVIITKEFLKD